MAIAIESTSGAEDGSNVASVTCSKPSGTAEGDLLIAYFTARRSGTKELGSTDFGGTNFLDEGFDTTDPMMSLFWKVAGASEPASWDFTIDSTNSRPCVNVARISGADTADPINVQSSISESTTSPSVNTDANNCMVCYCCTRRANDTTTVPSGTTLMMEQENSSSFGPFQQIGYKILASAGSSGTGVFFTEAAERTFTFAINEDVGGGGGSTVGRLVNGGLVNGGLVNRGLL